MTPTAWFLLIWAGWCIYGVYLMVRGSKQKPDPKPDKTSEEKYAETKEWIRIVSNSSIGRSVEENRRAMHVRDGKWF